MTGRRKRPTASKAVTALLLTALLLPAPSIPASAEALRKPGLGRGINVLGYDGVWDGAIDAPFRRENFVSIRAAGFDHVRINFLAFRHLQDDARLPEAVLLRLDGIIVAALEAGLVPVLDEHDTETCQRSVRLCELRLQVVWSQIANRYAGRFPDLVFELLNEPGGAMDATEWNRIAAALIRTIRLSNPERRLVVAAHNDTDSGITALDLPDNDRNLIVAVHYYSPFEFTHQGAPWSVRLRWLPRREWGDADDRARLDRDFRLIENWARAHDRPIYLGEFGAYEAAPLQSRLRWIGAVARHAEQLGWSWAYWQFDHDFAAFDTRTQSWNEPMLDALMGR